MKPHAWVFGGEGVKIYNPDGSGPIVTVPPEQACHNVTFNAGETYSMRCDFYDVVSDGKERVWAATSRGVPKIDMFSIKTGDMLGSVNTCNRFYDIDYNPKREEVWVHCGEFSENVESHMDVISTLSPSVPMNSDTIFHDNSQYRTYGRLEVDGSLGDLGLATVYGNTSLNIVDLSEKKVAMSVDLKGDEEKFKKLHGLYDLTYSSKNKHAFVRSQVCCTCGFEGADELECGRYGAGNITVDGELVRGQCGRHCEGGSTDTIGVIEFDTVSMTVVGNHPVAGTTAVDCAYASPDGERILFIGTDGGASVQIYEAGKNGEKSKEKYDIKLDFNVTGIEDNAAFSDHAFVKTNMGGKDVDLLILSGSNDHQVAIIDFNKKKVKAEYITYVEDVVIERARWRQVEWITGTQYVWINQPYSYSEENLFVIDILKMKVAKTLSFGNSRKILSVTNYGLLGLAQSMEPGKTNPKCEEDKESTKCKKLSKQKKSKIRKSCRDKDVARICCETCAMK